jgi:hypothetical protein
MKDEYKDLTLWEALAVMQREAPVIRKTETVDTRADGGKMHYNFAGYVTVWEAIAQLMDDLSLVWSAVPTMMDLGGGQTRFILEATLYHLPSKQSVKGSYPLKGERPQEIGSSMTYARRYLLVSVLNLRVAEDDDDAQATEERAQLSPSQQVQAARGPRKTVERKPPRPRQAPPPTPDTAADEGAVRTEQQRKKVFALVSTELGYGERAQYLEYVNNVLARHEAGPVGSTNELTVEQAGWVIEAAEKEVAGPEGEDT